jgi:uncharacterized protein (UPF0264 family)
VSVRNATEALCAARGGADIVDFKDPQRGSLGRADNERVHEAVLALRDASTDGGIDQPLSIALGELQELDDALIQSLRRLPAEVGFAKLGLAGLGDRSDWIGRWTETRTRVEDAVARPLQWVAVAYADVGEAGAPRVEEVAAAASQTHCAGVLIDTFSKTGGRLLDHFDASSLTTIREQVQQQQMLFAIAGRLRLMDLSQLQEVRPDIVAVRSAVCDQENRCASVNTGRVSAVAAALRSATGQDSVLETDGQTSVVLSVSCSS